MSRLRPKTASPTRVPLYARSKAKATDERKENAYVAAKSDSERRRSPPVLAQRSGHELTNVNMKFAKKNEPVKSTSRTRYLADSEPKPKTLATKRRNILAIRKPNAAKTPGIVKGKSRRAADDSENPRTSLVTSKLSKRSFSRALRVAARAGNTRCRAMASSSSDDVIAAGWEDVSGGTALGESSLASKRRNFSNTSPSRLKKIRLKSGL